MDKKKNVGRQTLLFTTKFYFDVILLRTLFTGFCSIILMSHKIFKPFEE